ncbi:hypothetical protein ABFS82_14G081900 [Erythranthe guttata]
MKSDRKLVCCGIIGFLALAALTVASHAVTTPPCTKAIGKLMPCKDYLVGKANGVTVSCCSSARSIPADSGVIQNLCACLKKAAKDMHIIPERAKALTGLCKLSTPFPVDPRVACFD